MVYLCNVLSVSVPDFCNKIKQQLFLVFVFNLPSDIKLVSTPGDHMNSISLKCTAFCFFIQWCAHIFCDCIHPFYYWSSSPCCALNPYRCNVF